MVLAGGLAVAAAACSSSPAAPPASIAPTAHSGSRPPASGSPRPASAAAAWQGRFTGYGDSAWRSAWGYLDQGSFGQAQLSVARNAGVPGGGPALRVLYGQGSSANSCSNCANPGGAQFYTSLEAMGKARLARAPVLYLRYYLKFPSGFDFGRPGRQAARPVRRADRRGERRASWRRVQRPLHVA